MHISGIEYGHAQSARRQSIKPPTLPPRERQQEQSLSDGQVGVSFAVAQKRTEINPKSVASPVREAAPVQNADHSVLWKETALQLKIVSLFAGVHL